MSIVVMPAPVRIRRIQWSLDRPAQINRSAYTGARRVVANPWHGKWSAQVELAPIVGEANVRAWRAFLASLKGQINTFQLPSNEGPQHSLTNPALFADAAQAATSMTLPLSTAEMVTNGTFASTTTGWTGNAATLSVAGGAMVVTNSGAASGYGYQSIPITNGQTYTLTADLTDGTAPSRITLGGSQGGIAYGTASGTGSKSITFTATTSTFFVNCWANSAVSGQTATFDNISLKPIVPALTAGMMVTAPLPSGNKQLLMLTADIAAGVVAFEPPLREAVTAGTTLETKNPYCLVALSDSSFGWSVDPGTQYGISFSAEEAF